MKHALIIQEDFILRELLNSMLIRKGYRCFTLSCLEDIEEKHLSVEYDLFVTDLVFSGMNEVGYVLQIKEIFQYKKLYIITGLGQNKIKRNILQLTDANAYLDYPVKLELLESQV